MPTLLYCVLGVPNFQVAFGMSTFIGLTFYYESCKSIRKNRKMFTNSLESQNTMTISTVLVPVIVIYGSQKTHKDRTLAKVSGV